LIQSTQIKPTPRDNRKALVSDLLKSLNIRPIDLGPLRNATTLEHLSVAWIHLAMPAGWVAVSNSRS